MKKADIEQGWAQEGTFKDANGVGVRAYDDVAVLEDTVSEPDERGSVTLVSAGTTGTVLFYSTGEPCYLDLEYELPGMVCGIVEAQKTRLSIRNEEKYPR